MIILCGHDLIMVILWGLGMKVLLFISQSI